MKLTSLAVGALLVVATSGCATVMSPGPDRVPIASYPPGARVYIDDMLVGQTPVVVELDRDRNTGRIRIETEGYHPAILLRSKSVEGWFWVNFACGGLIGFVIDLATGNFLGFDDTPIMVSLIPAEGAVPGYLPQPPPPPPGAAPPSAVPPGAAPGR
jgi:hypothetical protein